MLQTRKRCRRIVRFSIIGLPLYFDATLPSFVNGGLRILAQIGSNQTQGKASDLQRLKSDVKQQELDIQAMRVALRGIVTKFEIDYLRRLSSSDPWDVRFDPDTYTRLKRLSDMGFVLPTVIDGDRTLVRILERFGNENIPVEERQWFNMKDFVEITDDGKSYLRLYDSVARAL